MKNRKWFDIKDGAEFLGITKQELYALLKFRDLDMQQYFSTDGTKRLIKREGLLLLLNQRCKNT